jgi:hypothetical protein
MFNIFNRSTPSSTKDIDSKIKNEKIRDEFHTSQIILNDFRPKRSSIIPEAQHSCILPSLQESRN